MAGAWVTAVAWIQSLAWELPHAIAKRKKERKTDRQTERQKERQTDRHASGPIRSSLKFLFY